MKTKSGLKQGQRAERYKQVTQSDGTTARNVTITLQVEAERLYNRKPPPAKNQMHQFCKLIDSTTNHVNHYDWEYRDNNYKKCSPPIPEENELQWFTTNVDPGSEVKWVGESMVNGFISGEVEATLNEHFDISIDDIVPQENRSTNADVVEKSKNFFDKMVLHTLGSARIKDQVKQEHLKKDDIYVYEIIFTIYGPRGPRSFSIDPKLRIYK